MLTDFTKYRNTDPSPESKDYKTVYYYSKGALIAKQIGAGPIEYLTDTKDLTHTIVETAIDKDSWREARRAHNQKSNELREQFKFDLLEDLGVLHHPKADLLYSLAKEFADGGFESIYETAWYLVELMEI